MPKWCAVNSDTPEVLPLAEHTLAKVLIPSGWMMLLALVMRLPCQAVVTIAGEITTAVTNMKMLVSDVSVLDISVFSIVYGIERLSHSR